MASEATATTTVMTTVMTTVAMTTTGATHENDEIVIGTFRGTVKVIAKKHRNNKNENDSIAAILQS